MLRVNVWVNSARALFLVVSSVSVYAESTDERAIQYGRFQVTGPASELMDSATAKGLSGIVDADQDISWQMYVPETYDPKKPAGLMVFVSPTPRGRHANRLETGV